MGQKVFESSASNPTAQAPPVQHSHSTDLPDNPTSTSSQPQSTNPSTSAHPTVQSLPPQALELASRLFDMARTGETAMLTQYIHAGIPVNLTNSTGDTLLMLAAYHGHVECTKELLRIGADPDALNGRGQSIVAGACFKGYDEVVRALVEGVDGGGSTEGESGFARVGKANVDIGRPTAVETAVLFRRDECLKIMGLDPEGVVVKEVRERVPGVPGGMAPESTMGGSMS